jgi:hypothetical protein
VGYDPDFERFCEDLEHLKSRTPLYKPREGLTERIMKAVKKHRREHFRAQLKELVTPFTIAALLILIWFLSQIPETLPF